MKIFINSLDSRFGPVHFAADESNLLALGLPNETATEFSARMRTRYRNAELDNGGRITDESAKQVLEYLNGDRTSFDLPLGLDTTPFQQRVLTAVRQIPYGRTMTYSEIAEAIGSPRAARAIGMANARNPLPLIIPCHRVVSRDGLGGYGGGLELKEALLSLEAGAR